MPSFRLSYRPQAAPDALVIGFDALDAGAALNIAFRHAGSRAADLWCEDRHLCRIECSDDTGGLWLIS